MLFDSLKNNSRIPFHMPGHKRNFKLLGNDLPYSIDITEIEGFDNLYNPEGYIKEIEDKAKKIYHSDNSFVLVNGSTVGILAGINSVVNQGDTVLIARNCHKSVYNALEISKANVEYLVPNSDKYGVFSPVDVTLFKEKVINIHPKLVVITSPSYEGVMSDVESICNIAHSDNIPVMVDAAHGAHLIDYYKNCSADIIIMSLHKTLPALTQCALAHINGSLVDAQKFRYKLSVFETSSPSYVLMSSVEKCLVFIDENKNRFIEYYDCINYLHNQLKSLKVLKDLCYDDLGKIVIFTGYSNITGVELSDILRQSYNIEVEMASSKYIIAMTSVCDDFNNYSLLFIALKEIDSNLEYKLHNLPDNISLPKKEKDSFQIINTESIDLDKASGRISGEYIWAYPPGVPIIVPGEIISREVIEYIKLSIDCGVTIQSTYKELPKKIFCEKV
ncbi:MAG: aminotransferase class I/II-fold pyridoxal phosphate-dependent enzyme [Ruminococcus sp.]